MTNPTTGSITGPTVGRKYGIYQLGERLNKGGEAWVGKATNLNSISENDVVLKILRQDENADDGPRHFEQEVQIHKALNGSSHIVPLLDSGEDHGEYYLVMPHIPYGSLGDVLNKAKESPDKWPSPEECLDYIQQATEALSHVHEKGFIHRDVKPKNLLLGPDGIFLCDFGIAINAAAPLSDSRYWGSRGYRAPEQRDGNPEHASDQYGLAVTMYKLFTRQRPTKDDYPTKDEREKAKEKLKQISPKIAQIFIRAWDEDPKKRFPTMKDFADALKQVAHSDLPAQIPQIHSLEDIDKDSWPTSNSNVIRKHEFEVKQIQIAEMTLSPNEELLQQYCLSANVRDFDPAKVREYANLQQDSDQLPMRDLRELCKRLGLTSIQYIPLRWAVLAFHRMPSRHLPSALVRVTMSDISSGTPYLRENIEGPLSEQAERTIKWLTTNLNSVSENVGAGQRIDRCEIPERALRELIVNALLHRNYDAGESVQVKVTPQEVIITNPGQLDSEIERFKPPFSYKDSHPQNPVLLRMLEAQRWAEGRARGFQIIKEEFERYKLPLPRIRNRPNGLVEVVIQRPDLSTITQVNKTERHQTPRQHGQTRRTIPLILALSLGVTLIIGNIGFYLLYNTPATANLLTVTTLSDNGAGSLRQEIATAQKEHIATITFALSLQGTVELTQDLAISTNVSIEAPKAHQITIIPQGPRITLHIPQKNTVSFANIDFQGNNGQRANAFLVNEGTLSISTSRISNFQSTRDSALNNLGGTLTLTQCEIDHNQAFGIGGGAFSNYNGTVTLNNSNVHDNQANYNGGGIYSLNGQVFIQNQSSITHNQVLLALTGGDLGGGGGMTIHGGSVSISASSIEHNISQGDGGGILLIGTNALIDGSHIQFNQTNTDLAGGITVVTNPENNYNSFLVLADNTVVQYNSNLNATFSTDFAVNIEGKVVSQDAANTSINSEPTHSSVEPTTFPQFLGFLTPNDFQTYCQSQQNSQKKPFTNASISSDGQTITCTSSNSRETLSLSTQNGKVSQVCAMLHPTAKLTLARLFRYTDPTSWQCFQDEQSLSGITQKTPSTNKVPLDSYCAGRGATAVLTPEPGQPANAYDWRCKQGTTYVPITMDVACQDVTGVPLAIGILVDYSDPAGWQCWGP